MKKTVIIGCIHKELNVLYERLPQANEEGSPLSVSSAPGGSGYETALLYEKIGFPYELLAGYGSGIYAEETKAEAAKESIFAKETEITAGCGYHMFDKDGNESLLTIPGGEYDFPADIAYELDSQDLRTPIVFGEIMTGSDPENVLSFLYDLSEPYTFVPSHCWSEIDVFLREEILRMKPRLHLSMAEADEFVSGEYSDPLDCAKEIYSLSEGPVILVVNGEGSLYYDGQNSYFAPYEDSIDICRHAAVFHLAANAGIGVRNALLLANQYAWRESWQSCRNSDAYFRDLKEEIKRIILQK